MLHKIIYIVGLSCRYCKLGILAVKSASYPEYCHIQFVMCRYAKTQSMPTGFKTNKRKPCTSIKNHFSVTDRFSRLRDNVQGSLSWGSLPTGFKRKNRKPCTSIKDHFSVTDRFSRLRDNVQGSLTWGS